MDDEARGDKSSTSNFPSLVLISERTDRVWQTFENSKTPLLAAYARSSPLLSLLDRRYANGGMNTARAIITGEGISRNENETFANLYSNHLSRPFEVLLFCNVSWILI